MTVKSFAKINLGLEIVGKRPDGYHDIRTLFQTISLADELDFEPAPDGVVELAGDDPAVAWDRTNLVHRAARLLQGERRDGQGREDRRQESPSRPAAASAAAAPTPRRPSWPSTACGASAWEPASWPAWPGASEPMSPFF